MHQTSDKHIRQAVHCHNSFRKARKIKVVFLHDNPPNPFENGVKVQLLFCGKINRRVYAPERNVYVPAGGVKFGHKQKMELLVPFKFGGGITTDKSPKSPGRS